MLLRLVEPQELLELLSRLELPRQRNTPHYDLDALPEYSQPEFVAPIAASFDELTGRMRPPMGQVCRSLRSIGAL